MKKTHRYLIFIMTVALNTIVPTYGRELVEIKIVGINDFHGQITTDVDKNGRRIGGAAVLAAYLNQNEIGHEQNTIITFIGDQIGASVPESGLLNHQPTILALNKMGNRSCNVNNRMSPGCNIVATVGNHEFDHGRDQLFDLIYGNDKPPVNAWIDLPKYQGASFPHISANIIDKRTGKTLFPPYVIKHVNGISVAFIGAILKDAADSMLPENAVNLKFIDEAEAINYYLPEIKRKGATVIVVLIHNGGDSNAYTGSTHDNVHVEGQIKDVVSKLDDVDVVMAGHTHRFLNAYLPNKYNKRVLVTQAYSYSKAFAEIVLRLDNETKKVIEKSASINMTYADQYPGTLPDAQVEYIVKRATDTVAPIVNRKIGYSLNPILKTTNDAGESALGNLVADAFKEGMLADIAVTNATSIRTDIKSGDITWGNAYAVQPFSNPVLKLSFKGNDLKDLLEQQWKTPYVNILQISGLSYAYNDTAPLDHRVLNIVINGKPLVGDKTYTIATNSYLASGGSGFTVMLRGKKIADGKSDLDMLVAYIEGIAHPLEYKIEGRVRKVNQM